MVSLAQEGETKYDLLSDERREGGPSDQVHKADSLTHSEKPSHLLITGQIVSHKHFLVLEHILIFLFCRRLRAYESHLSTVALSNVESSRTVSQILYDMANSSDFA